ncbi:asparagine synthase (glutamine-hydrolyzing) [Dechloromonas sp. XY25]|uniref:asparagine synthase (glutamine-hydrolyzing) n=1 Tax=Dechloromonas hankyongensis TaxID=2908002 RepID=A0ABS9K1R4_9RHOO|nr:asparagine synthase (glutamine-hydrolyzing) [Dechloromonas hankyongensis]MCG2577110.1 asparagine synthase (glutamine-hydrolyzing) [Dechloromonas hankyongensis]
MCGLTGFFSASSRSISVDSHAVLTRMAETILSRGPDDQGIWFDSSSGIGLAHRRLSILDLSEAGHQPMESASGRFVIAFNGEIYNHQMLRDELGANGMAPAWRGHSDTETILAGCESWGIRQTLERCIGMFAFALWDKVTRTLTLARDRLGEKPLYYGWVANRSVFLFGSELKALRAHPAFDAEIDRGALALYMRHNYIPAPYSIFRGVRKLLPGTLITLGNNAVEPVVQPYWSLAEVARTGARCPFVGTPEDAVDELERLLRSAVRQQMVADVPLGAFLSGGIDSSTVVALMQAQSVRPVKTFTIGFDEGGYNEAVHAKAVAQHLGTEHTELYVTPAQALEVIPRLPELYCEPFADSSQVPTFLVSQLARRHVTVSLSGDAGDELFAGYNRYVLGNRLWGTLSRLPRIARRGAVGMIKALSPSAWNTLLRPVETLLPRSLRQTNIGDKLHKGAGVLESPQLEQLYLGLVTHWLPSDVVLNTEEPPTFLQGNVPDVSGLDDIQKMMVLDALSYLPDDILTKVDRAGMGVSLEGRVPFLDHRVVEFAWRLPQSMKLREGVGKWALRQVLYRHVPQALIDRPKMGFGIPIDSWLRGSLRDWAESLLDEGRLRREGYFSHAAVRERWEEHLSGRRNWSYHLWDVLMFQAWLERQ